MGKRRKTRTHNRKPDAALAARGGPGAIPKTFVVKTGHVGSSVSSLIGDMRRLLEPNTASRLKERKRNRLRDFVAMSGPLGVSHLLVFSQTPSTTEASLSNVNLRLSRMPRGPTLSFKVLRYALMKDVLAASKHAHSPGREFATEPLLILNNFGGEEKQLKLMTAVFQNLFPSIHVQTMPLTSARRVVLISYNSTTRTIELRHYLISIRQIGISKPIRKIIEGSSHARPSTTSSSSSAAMIAKGVPDLSRASDISEYVLHHADLGYASSASEAESDVEGAGTSSSKRVELPGGYVGRGNKRMTAGEQRAVKLVELGPRMELGLVKIEDGLGGNEGEIVFHEYLSKTNKEKAELAKRRKEKADRRKQQEVRVKAKAAAAEEAKKSKGKAAAGREEEEEEEIEEEETFEEVAQEDDDFAYEDLYGEGADDEAQDDILDEVLDHDDDEEASGDEEEEARPAKNPRLAGRDASRPKFVLRKKR